MADTSKAQRHSASSPATGRGARRVILLGPPGAGKGTQAKLLSGVRGIVHIASGDLFREHQQKGTELGRLVKSYMERGELVPDQVTIRMVLDRISAPDCQRGFLLDGFPRTLEQARALEEALARGVGAIDLALFIRVSEAELVKRLGGRLVCRSCQAPYNLNTSLPKVEGRCDRCGGELYQRADDAPEAVARRIRVYQQETEPLVEYYRSRGNLVEVEGEGSIEEVGEALLRTLA